MSAPPGDRSVVGVAVSTLMSLAPIGWGITAWSTSSPLTQSNTSRGGRRLSYRAIRTPNYVLLSPDYLRWQFLDNPANDTGGYTLWLVIHRDAVVAQLGYVPFQGHLAGWRAICRCLSDQSHRLAGVPVGRARADHAQPTPEADAVRAQPGLERGRRVVVHGLGYA